MMKRFLLILFLCLTCFAQWSGVKPPLGTQVDWSKPVNRGLVGRWLCNEGGGSFLNDLSGNGNHGTVVNALWKPGKFGPCLSFDGTGDYVDLGDVSAVEGIGGITVGCWVKSDIEDPTVYSFPVAKYGSGYDTFLLARTNLEQYYFQVFTGDGTTSATSTSPTNAGKDTNWHHLLGTYDGKYVQIYLDGVALDTTPGEVTGLIHNTTHSLKIGESWNGSIDDVMIYNRALSPNEVALLTSQPFDGLRREPVEYYVTSGAPPAPSRAQVIIMSSIPAWVILIMAAACVTSRRKKEKS